MRRLATRVSLHRVLVAAAAAAVAAATLLAAVAAAARQEAGPDSPGSVALLAGKTDAASIEALARAVRSGAPLVRAVGARAAGVVAAASLGDAVAAAFDREGDPTAAVEQARALLFLRGEAATGSIERRLASVPDVAIAYGEWLVRMQPERFPDLLERLPAQAVPSLEPAVKGSLARRPEFAERVLRAWLAARPAAPWIRVLDGVDLASPGITAAIAHALGVQDEPLREDTVWMLVDRLAEGLVVPGPLLEAAAAPLPGAAPADSGTVTWERFGRELVARRSGVKTPDRAALIKSEGRGRQRQLQVLWLLDLLSKGERAEVKRLLDNPPPGRAASGPPASADETGVWMRTIPAAWPGVVGAVMEAAGCSPGPGANAAVLSVTYRPDGRTARLTLQDTRLPAPCGAAASSLAALTLHDLEHGPPAGQVEMLVLPLDPDYIACASASESVRSRHVPSQAGSDASSSSGKVKAPKKTRHVNPVYPAAMQELKVQGTVWVEATITPAGCVAAGRLVKSPHLLLGLSSLWAVSGWRFEPTLLAGKPVPVIISVAVDYKLR
ncbi:MAG TPA: energy transducer TonB [Vicinamibacterales bacterium]|nr:energy transducer TonB [Acidobacteriota bacterium]HOC18817.1 energy transducer TonB [Vicinamibacterales bacterium]